MSRGVGVRRSPTARRPVAVGAAVVASVVVLVVVTVVVAGGLPGPGGDGAGAAVVAGGGATSSTPYYLALGDSLAAGVGSPDGKGYVADVYAREAKKIHGLKLENLSCSGATTGSMIDGGGCSYTTGSQLGDAEAFLSAHPGQVAFVTVDIGANDVDGCTDGTTVNITCVTTGLDDIGTNLPTILSGLRSAGGSTPVLGMSYYDPFLAEWLLGSDGQNLAEESIGLLEELNGTLTADYGATATARVEQAFKSQDFALHGSYDGTTVPVNVGRICAWTLMCSEENIHADDAGHAVIAKAFETVIRRALVAGRRG